MGTTKWRMTRKGMVSTSSDGTNSCEMSFKRIPDIMGKWNLVVKEGVETQLDAVIANHDDNDSTIVLLVITMTMKIIIKMMIKTMITIMMKIMITVMMKIVITTMIKIM